MIHNVISSLQIVWFRCPELMLFSPRVLSSIRVLGSSFCHQSCQCYQPTVEERANRSEFLLRAFPTQTKSHLLRDMKRKGSSLQCSPYSYCGILEDKEEKRGWLLIYCYHSANNYSRPELQAALRETSHISLHRTKCGTSLQ